MSRSIIFCDLINFLSTEPNVLCIYICIYVNDKCAGVQYRKMHKLISYVCYNMWSSFSLYPFFIRKDLFM